METKQKNKQAVHVADYTKLIALAQAIDDRDDKFLFNSLWRDEIVAELKLAAKQLESINAYVSNRSSGRICGQEGNE
jgi:hypothetical protein